MVRGSVLDPSDLSASAEVPSPVAPAPPAARADPRPPPGNPPPITVADHELLRVIGRGAYGEVWLARHTRLGTLRAAKTVRRDQFADARPFQREFEGIRRYEPISRGHPNLVAILHVGGGDECFYYVMELADALDNPKSEIRNPKEIRDPKSETPAASEPLPVSGSRRAVAPAQRGGFASDSALRPSDFYQPHTLRSELKQHGALPIARCLEIAHALAGALAHLHAHGLVHRDVKPSNVIFVDGLPKLADVGLVAGLEESRSFVGTEGYIPPEGPGTPSADCYSLGKALYEMSTGRDRQDFPQLPADLRESSDCAALVEFNEILVRACESEASRRYKSAQEMLADLELLRRGRSVKRRRTLQHCLRAGKKAGIALAGFAALAASVAVSTRWPVGPPAGTDGPPSTNSDATMLCEKGMLIIRGDNTGEFLRAYTNFHRAMALDPRYARPYVGPLELRLRESVPGLGPAPPEEMRTIAQRLHKLAPNLAATHCAQAVIHWADWNYAQAQRCALQAVKADPGYELGHTWYAFLLLTCGYPDEARRHLAVSEALRPSKAAVYRVRGQTYYVERDYTNAIAWENKALELEPGHGVALYTIGEAHRAMGDYSKALDNLELAAICEGRDTPQTRRQHGQLRQALKEGGPPGYWQELLKQTASSEFYWKGVAQLHLGNTNEALNCLEKSCAVHEHWPGSHDGPLSYLLLDQDWDGLHDDARFKAVVDKVGFTKVTSARNSSRF